MFPTFISKLQSKFDSALQSDGLTFIPTQVSHLESGSGVKFEIRLAPSLNKKPEKSNVESKTIKNDPFLPPYSPDLFVCESEAQNQGDSDDSYVIVLNKYCVVPRHFLMVTKAFKSQSSPPSPRDLLAVINILDQAHLTEPNSDWLSFYNCGPQSGASFQFIPIQHGENPLGSLIERSAPVKEEQVFNLLELKFAHFIIKLPQANKSNNHGSNDGLLESIIGERFMLLLDSMIDHLRHLPGSSSLEMNQLSYNIAITRSYMILVPRSSEMVSSTGISINSLAVGAGMVLVKSQDQLDQLKHMGIDSVLAHVTFPVLTEFNDPCLNEG
ncbi:ATP adenylyltransferase-domain-containing protein [Phakopsora pachyrhizi]|uniref:ATP adenylyltransferase-domain-containing protein n=1 Tax=Phakopsora pachyrhizi TaxID=170000 RepID=A0AAV0BPU7_PHAPC|nr:ATP adenylyltransferase-domain-containing protein [Phakopsora pachyrhizi]CAH7687236.1 ATP adenylyltransferase-domain-containing protein [Phakopsora pachyrhizi]CAH7688667.1 ATP adenylyltransferase-domain-containing protein [Phakopsora pachyrhizi]